MIQKRLFIAIPLPESIRIKLASSNTLLPHEDVRLTKPENLHITVLFIGSVPQEEMDQLENKLSPIIDILPFQLQLKEVIPVIRRGLLSMFWATFEESPDFKELALRTSEITGVRLDHPPLPHITLARVRHGRKVKGLSGQFPSLRHLRFMVNSLGLWESRLTPDGPVYTRIKEWTLVHKE